MDGRDESAEFLTQVERRANERRAAAARRRRTLRAGQLLMAVGLAIAVIHWLAHLGAFGGPPSGVADLLVGYPTGGLLFLAGAVAAGR